MRATIAFALLCLNASSVAASGVAAASFADLRVQAMAYEHGEGVARNGARAAELYCEAAAGGDAEAQYSLGFMHANGRGVPRDDAVAAYFFDLAARQGHAHAQRMLRYVGEPGTQMPDCLGGLSPQAYAEATPAQRKVIDMIRRLAPEYGVSPRLALAVAHTESGLQPGAVSPRNAQGLMQLIPETSQRFNVRQPFDPEQNVRGGLAYLRWLLAYYEGNVPLTLAAYNAGEGAVNRYRGIPPYAETRNYVTRIMQSFRRESHPFDAAITEPSPELARCVVKRTW
ncbi:MAG: transglycosylase SLT domain-containing protein [Rhodocyclaceae bacterium]|nr:transglycosylase SLT domain-containing protein [Rhodocyclaceae bacterium]